MFGKFIDTFEFLAKDNFTLVNSTSLSVMFLTEIIDHLNFLQNVVNEIAKSGSSKVVLSYRTTNTITKPVTFSIKIDANFKF